MINWGERLRAFRLAAELKQASLATDIGVSRETISAWENNRTSPTIRDLEAYLPTVGKTLEDLFCSPVGKDESDEDKQLFWCFREIINSGGETERRGIRNLIGMCYDGLVSRLQHELMGRGRKAQEAKKGKETNEGNHS
jgi:transcriptional regulator with XRE-family HTH domain